MRPHFKQHSGSVHQTSNLHQGQLYVSILFIYVALNVDLLNVYIQ